MVSSLALRALMTASLAFRALIEPASPNAAVRGRPPVPEPRLGLGL
jgi:hypothetical protein